MEIWTVTSKFFSPHIFHTEVLVCCNNCDIIQYVLANLECYMM
jgi:hypothetical protein